MCRYSTTNLSSTECDLYRAGGAAHYYTQWIYWLCRDSEHGMPCSDKKPKEDQIENDSGWRTGTCPVCQNIKLADEKYKYAVQRATEIFNATVAKAFDTHTEEMRGAKDLVELVCKVWCRVEV